jgi:hypothetical protein
MEEAYQEYRQRQGQRAKALELKQAKAVKPGDLFQPTEEVGSLTRLQPTRDREQRRNRRSSEEMSEPPCLVGSVSEQALAGIAWCWKPEVRK